MILCCVPGCARVAAFTTKRLCRRHYDRARYRVQQGIEWSVVLSPSGLALLAARFAHSGLQKAPRKTRTTPRDPYDRNDDNPRPPVLVWEPAARPGMQSCITCENLLPVPPRLLACAKNNWPDRMRSVAINHVEQCGLPPVLHQYARNCPYYALFKRAGTKRIE